MAQFLDRASQAWMESVEPRQLYAATAWAAAVDNPLSPFLPGMTWVYRGTKDGQAEKNRTVVLDVTKTIKGVACTVVLDRVYLDGKLSEKTYDWYAQDHYGNVWYFGEDTREFNADGTVNNTDGTWQAGVNGANPGIVMEAAPIAGDSYGQEYAAPVAEDHAKVTGTHRHYVTPFATFSNTIVTQETSALEPGAAERKFYAPGIGFIGGNTLSGDESEVLKLVSFVP